MTSTPGRRLLAAPDTFRGSASAPEVARAVAAAAETSGWSCVQLPLADGGEGTLDAFGGGNRTSRVTGPHGFPLVACVTRATAEWLRTEFPRD